MSMEASLPNDLEACQRELSHLQSVLSETALVCEDQHRQIEQLTSELELLRRYVFGRRRERFVEAPNQGRLFEDPEQADRNVREEQEQITYRRRKRGHGWASFRSTCLGKKS